VVESALLGRGGWTARTRKINLKNDRGSNLSIVTKGEGGLKRRKSTEDSGGREAPANARKSARTHKTGTRNVGRVE